LETFWWGSLFLALAPIALAAVVGAMLFVPASTDDSDARLDRGGLLASVVMLGALVYTIIEAPEHGWGATRSLLGFGLALAAALTFVWWERRQRDPLIDVSLFTNLRFSAASGAVTVAFFALFGFIFLITQFFQLLKGFGPLETGVRILPVALSIAVGSVLGTQLAVTRLGTKAVVFVGLLMLTSAFAWVAAIDVDVPYLQVAAQMVLLGGGLGLTTAPATDSIMGVVRPEQAGAGSAVNDATRQVGGTLGVAVVGSIFSTLYIRHLSDSEILRAAPDPAQATAREGLAQGLQVAAQSPPSVSAAVRDTVSDAFMAGLHAGCLTAAAVCLVGAFFVLAVLPAHPAKGEPA
jgi:predicted MFS family arabinose efflux permease